MNPEQKIKECYCNDDRASGYFENGHFSSCPFYGRTPCDGYPCKLNHIPCYQKERQEGITQVKQKALMTCEFKKDTYKQNWTLKARIGIRILQLSGIAEVKFI